MFQNININHIQENEYEELEFHKKNTTKKILKNIFTKQNIILYIISFMVSTVGIGPEISPFAIAILASCCSNRIPVGIIYVLTCIGTFFGFGSQSTLLYILNTLVFMVSFLLIRPKYNESNNRLELTLHVLISCLIVQIGKLVFDVFLVYDLLEAILFSISACIFYKIFSGSINVLKDYKIKTAFSVEEVIGASLIIGIAIAGFKDTTILGFSLKNIFSILLVLILGWQNGVLIGGTTGITIGVVLGIISNGEPIQLAIYAFSGMLAGILNKLGKIGVIAGFIIGNLIITYFANGNTTSIIMLKEILIASIALLVIPKNIKINIDDLFGNNKFLPVNPEKRLSNNQETIYKLNNVSEVISQVSQAYGEVAATVIEEKEIKQNKDIFIKEFKNNLYNLSNNILYEDLVEEDNFIINDIFEKLEMDEFIEIEDLIKIFEKHNNYIIGFDDDKDTNIKNDIKEIVKTLNNSYKTSKINIFWTKKMDENKKTMQSQLQGISKAISSIAEGILDNDKKDEETQKREVITLLSTKKILVNNIKIKKELSGKIILNLYIDNSTGNLKDNLDNIEKILSKVFEQKLVLQSKSNEFNNMQGICRLNYMSEDKYYIQLGIAKATKSNSPISGDTSLKLKLEDGKHLLAISDGMGSGPNARKSSQIAIKMLQRLLMSGFDKEFSIDLINSSISLNSEEETYATLDIAILDLYKGNIEFIKSGACQTFIKNNKNVDIIKLNSLPTGILNKIDLNIYDRDIKDNDILVMCSDGIIESNSKYENKELWVKYLLEDINTDNVQKIADIILNESIDNGYGIPKDDMTVIVAKINKKNL